MYITLWQKFGGHPENFSFMQFSQKIDGFRQKDFRTPTTPLDIFNFHHNLPKLYIGFKVHMYGVITGLVYYEAQSHDFSGSNIL